MTSRRNLIILTTLFLSSPAFGQVAGTTTIVTPGVDVKAAFEALRPGDTLKFAPGTYQMGSIAPVLAPGTATKRIVVTVIDPANPPLLRGRLILRAPSYWDLRYLRVQATDVAARAEAITIAGGIGWNVVNSEFFGASETGSFANVAISNLNKDDPATAPKGWQFIYNCVHDAGRGTEEGHTSSTDHNVYVNASGDATGLIARNVLFNATAGSNVKVGNGGDAVTPGASNVRIEYNTMYNSARQIIVFGNVGGIVAKGNLLIRSTGAVGPVGVRLVNLSRPKAVTVAHNYGYLMDRLVWITDSTGGGSYTDGGDNFAYDDAGHDPWVTAGCGRFQTKNAHAAPYGVYSAVAY